ncbi:MAG: MobF family relaxase [Cyanobacteria bacterium P01_A01_bin.40]
MLSQSKIQATNKNYYLSLGKEDYYTEKGNLNGRWLGSGVDDFQLAKKAIEKGNVEFKNLLNGYSTDGQERLRKSGSTVRIYRNLNTGEITKKANPVCGIDNTFSAPKDVSLLWALGDEKTSETVLKAHQTAVAEAIDYLDSQVYTRSHSRNPDGSRTMEWHKAQGTFAVFDHFTSRELDPQLHSHAVLANACISECGEHKGSVDADKIFEARYIAGQLYLNTLRRTLENKLGIKTFDRPFSQEKGVSFGVNGVTQTQRESFSLRSMQIQKHITHEMTGEQINAIALKTRKAKTEPANLKELHGIWRFRGKALGFDVNKVLHWRESEHNKTPQEAEVIGKKILRKVTEKPIEKAKEKITQKVEKGLNKLSKFDKNLTTESEKLFRDVAQSLRDKIDFQYERRDRELEKKETYQRRKAAYIQDKIAEGFTEESAKEKHKKLYPRPVYRTKTIENPNIGLVKKGDIELAIMQHNHKLQGDDVLELAEKFQKQYTVEVKQSRYKKKSKGYDSTKRMVTEKYMYSLNLEGQELAKQKTTREQLVTGIADLNQRYKALSRNVKSQFYEIKAKNFDTRLKWYYATGRISHRKYLQLRDRKYLEYNKFQLEILRGFGVLSGKQIKHAYNYQKMKENPYLIVRELEKSGKINGEEARQIARSLYGEQKKVKTAAQERADKQAIAQASRTQSPFDYERTRERRL